MIGGCDIASLNRIYRAQSDGHLCLGSEYCSELTSYGRGLQLRRIIIAGSAGIACRFMRVKRPLWAGCGECMGYHGCSKRVSKTIRLHVAKCRATMYGYPRG